MKNRPFVSALLIFTFILGAGLPAARADYTLQRQSQFQEKLVSRNVFWPIGYVHVDNTAPRTKAAPIQMAPALSAEKFIVSSILIGGGLPLAVINGRDKAVGDSLSVDGVNVQVAAIRDGFVVLRANGTEIAAALKR